MADWAFDGVNRIIKEPNIGSGNLTWSVERDIYSAWKRWAQDNSQFLAAFSVEGGTPIGATGIFTGKTVILINGWKLQAGDWDHLSFVTGNLFSDDGIDVVANPNFSASLKTFGSVNAQGIATNNGGNGTSEADWTSNEKKQIRDALGVDGDKKVAKGGQLQEKSEYPNNSTVNTNIINNNDI